MGPISNQWYEERGLNPSKDCWAGGRIDIYGLDEREYFEGKHEYSLPVMDCESWEMFSEWLDDYESNVLKSYEELLSTFEADTNHKINWAYQVFE
jgi:hypothetical protein